MACDAEPVPHHYFTTEFHSMTIRDLAKTLGVSVTTVSAAMTGNGRVSEATRQRVLQAAQEHGFIPNPHARKLSWRGGKDTICLLSLGLASGVVVEKLVQLQRYLVQQGFNVPLHSLGWTTEEKNLIDDVRLMREVCMQNPRAIICQTFGFSSRALLILEEYRSGGGIVVTYDHEVAQFDNVTFDRAHNTYLATNHLLEMGHRSILFAVHTHLKDKRYEGYKRALNEYGVLEHSEWVVSCIHHGASRGIELADAFCAMDSRPTAACIVNDEAAMVFIAEMQKRGFRVPQDISVIGHDDWLIAPYAPVPLTTVTHPVQEIVGEILRLLNRRLSSDTSPVARRCVVRGKLVVRQSVASFSGRE